MKKCSADGCSNARQKIHCKNKTFFKFPLKSDQLLQVWLKNIGRPNFKPSSGSIVCSDHFHENSFNICPFTRRRKLKSGAVPLPNQRPKFVLLTSTTNGNYLQLDKTKQILQDAVPPIFLHSPSFIASKPSVPPEKPDDEGKIQETEAIKADTASLQEQVEKEENEQTSAIQQRPCEKLSHTPNCVSVLLNSTMVLLPLNLNQAPTVHFTADQFENHRADDRRLLKQSAVPSVFSHRNFDADLKKNKIETISRCESQNVSEAPIAIKQEPVESADEAPHLVMNKIHQTEKMESSTNSLPSVGSSVSVLSSTSSLSSPFSSAPFPQNALPIAYPDSSNLAETSAPFPKYVLSIAYPDSSNVAQTSTPFPEYVLPIAYPDSSNVAETSIVIKEEPVESIEKPPRLVTKKMYRAEEMVSSSSNSSPSITSSFSILSSTSSSSSSCGSTPFPENVLPFVCPDSTKVDEISTAHIQKKPAQKRTIFIADAEPDDLGATSDATQAKQCWRTKPSTPPKKPPSAVASKKKSIGCTPKTSQADLCWRTLMTMTSKRNSDLHLPAGSSKKSAGTSTVPTENGENTTKEMLQSFLDGSENNPLSGSRATEKPGDLFDVFADFIADKLRKMDLDDCALALRSIVDIVSKTDDVLQDS